MPAQLTVWLIIDRKKKNTGAQWCPQPTVSRQTVSSLAGEGHRLPAFSVCIFSEFYLRREHECDAVGERGVEVVVGGAVVEEVVDGCGEGDAAP